MDVKARNRGARSFLVTPVYLHRGASSFPLGVDVNQASTSLLLATNAHSLLQNVYQY